ncbi:MAG: hypothetical protein GXP55_04325, partial [Deltaproteobacteria bacterium]|nr:hypothetical protein [Deltaproteobacteria bacterium]
MIRYAALTICLACVLPWTGCDDPTPAPSAPPTPATPRAVSNSNAQAANTDVPVTRLMHNDPDAVRAYHEAMTAAAAGGG